MKKSSYMIGIAALLVVAAFAIAGVASVDADAEADVVEPAKTTVYIEVVDADGASKASAPTTGTVNVTVIPGVVNTAEIIIDGNKLTIGNVTVTATDGTEGVFAKWVYVVKGAGATSVGAAGDIRAPLVSGMTVTESKTSGDVAAEAMWIKAMFDPAIEITFNMNDGSADPAVKKVSVKTGVPFEKPTDPTRAGYTFEGWYTDSKCTESKKWDFTKNSDNTALSGKILYAHWVENDYDIIFNAGDSQIITVTNTELKTTFVAPILDRVGYTFAGWYDGETLVFDKDGKYVVTQKNEEGEDEFAAITADMTVTAKFVANNMTVTFIVGEFTSKQTVLYGECAMAPALPEGYDAWLDADGNVFDFKTPITADITITAQVAAVEPEPEVTVYNVTFEIEGKNPVVQKSDSIAIPSTARDGYNFVMWVVKGAPNQPVNPLNYEYTEDVTFIAVYEKAVPAEPGFFETPTGKCVAILAVFVLGFLLYKAYPTVIAPRLEKVTKKGGKKE